MCVASFSRDTLLDHQTAAVCQLAPILVHMSRPHRPEACSEDRPGMIEQHHLHLAFTAVQKLTSTMLVSLLQGNQSTRLIEVVCYSRAALVAQISQPGLCAMWGQGVWA